MLFCFERICYYSLVHIVICEWLDLILLSIPCYYSNVHLNQHSLYCRPHSLYCKPHSMYCVREPLPFLFSHKYHTTIKYWSLTRTSTMCQIKNLSECISTKVQNPAIVSLYKKCKSWTLSGEQEFYARYTIIKLELT